MKKRLAYLTALCMTSGVLYSSYTPVNDTLLRQMPSDRSLHSYDSYMPETMTPIRKTAESLRSLSRTTQPVYGRIE